MLKITDKEFYLLSAYIKEHSGIHLKPEKKSLLVGRLSKLMDEYGYDNFLDYCKHLEKEAADEELSRLIDKVTTNHTYFMREESHFDFLAKIVLPELKSKVRSRDLRFWCAASSSGEEPYTLEMILLDFFNREVQRWDTRLLATDLSTTILEKAKEGIYEESALDKMPKIWKMSYFQKIKNGYVQVKPLLKEQVIFRRFNLLEEIYPFKKKFHVIFCRNVMIYFDEETRRRVVNKMYDALEEGGYLFIGHSETINRDYSKFKYVRPAIFKK